VNQADKDKVLELRKCHHCDVIVSMLYQSLSAQDFDACMAMVIHALEHKEAH